MDRTQSGVAVAHGPHDDANGNEVVDVAELLALAYHLLEDRPQVLGPAGDLVVGEVGALEVVVEQADGRGHVRLTLLARVLYQARDALVVLGLEIEEGQVLELPLDGRDAQAVGERRVDVHGLARLEPALLGRERSQGTHVVQAVGQLDDDHANVLGHGQKHLAQVERLLLVARVSGDGGQLGHAVNELGHRLAKQERNVGERDGGVLHGVMKQRRADDVLVHLEVVGQDDGNLDGMVDVGLARAPALVGMATGGKLVGLRHLGQLLGRHVV